MPTQNELVYSRLNKLLDLKKFMSGDTGYIEKGKKENLFLTFQKVNNTELVLTEWFDLCGNAIPDFIAVIRIDLDSKEATVLSLSTEFKKEYSYDKNGDEKPKVKQNLNRFVSTLLLSVIELDL